MALMKKIIFTLLIVVFMGASISDIFLSVKNYLRYETDVIVKYVTPVGSFLPMVTFCGPKAQFINDKYYEEKFGHPVVRPIPQEESNQINDFLSDMSVEQQFKALYSAENLKDMIKWHVIHDERGPFHWADQIQTSLNSELFCFTMEHSFEHKYYSHGMEYDPAMSFQLSFKIPEILAYVHNSGESLFDLKEHKYQIISLESNKVTNLNYELTIINLLPAPYDTNCKRYQTQGSESYYRLYNNYIKQGFVRQYGCLPDNYLIQAGEDMKICGKDQVDQKFLDKLFYQVSKNVHVECEQEFYSLQQDKAFSLNPRNNLTDAHTIKVYPDELNKYMIYIPEMHFMELMNNVVDELCEWLALLCVYLLISILIESHYKNKMNPI